MKKFFIYLALAMPLVAFMGCSENKDETENELSLNKSEISLFHEETEQLEASEDVEWSSESKFVAKVDQDGLVEGNHVGKTFILASNGSEITKCEIEVIPQYETFIEPVLDFTASKDEVKSKETRKKFHETETGLMYNGENNAVKSITYLFKNGELYGVAVIVNYAYASEILSFIDERYQVIGEEDDVYVFINNDIDKYTMGVALSVYSGNLMITYMPESPSTRSGINVDKYKGIFEQILHL